MVADSKRIAEEEEEVEEEETFFSFISSQRIESDNKRKSRLGV